MKILISGGYFGAKPYVDNTIEVSVAKALKQMGHTCDVVGMTYDIEDEIVMVNGVRVYKVPYAKRIVMDARLAMKNEFHTDGTTAIPKKEKLLFAFRHPVFTYVMYRNKSEAYRMKMLSDYTEEVVKLIEQNQYDAIVSVVFSFEKTEELFLSNRISIPKIYYQLDPFGLSEYAAISDGTTSVDREVKVMEQADHILTTEELLAGYKKDSRYKHLIDKMSTARFPTLNKDKEECQLESVFAFDPTKINILFSGTLDDGPRNPEFALQTIHELMKLDDSIRFYFLGRFESKVGKEYIANHAMSITMHDAVSASEAEATNHQADVLLNISNTYTNMVPSKIFSYFETGKPILNFQKIENCPTKKYFDRYSEVYTVNEFEKTVSMEELLAFVQSAKHKHVSSNLVYELYKENTPEYVAKQFEEILTSILD